MDIDIESLLAQGAMRTAKLHASLLNKASALSSLTMASGKSTGWDRTKDRLYNTSHGLDRLYNTSHAITQHAGNVSETEANSTHIHSSGSDAAESVKNGEVFYLDLGKRRRAHVSGFYNEEAAFRDQLRSVVGTTSDADSSNSVEDKMSPENHVKVPRNLSCPQLFDFMLLDIQAITTLYRLKRSAWLHAHAAAVSEEQLKKLHKTLLASVALPRDLAYTSLVDLPANGVPCNAEDGTALDGTSMDATSNASVWSDAQEAELQQELACGFLGWTQRDMMAFKSAMLRHGGRHAPVEYMQRALPHKNAHEVSRYLKAFWLRGPCMLRTWPTILKQVDEAQRLSARHLRIMQVSHLSCLSRSL